MFDFDYQKAVQALNFFAIKEGGKINKMKAIKLIWLSDRKHLRQYGRTILSDSYIAMPYGPVPSNTKDIIEDTRFSSPVAIEYKSKYLQGVNKYYYRSIADLEPMVFSKTDLIVLEHIYEKFKEFSECKLSEISHHFPEWKKFEHKLSIKLSSSFKMDYSDFFCQPDIDISSIFNEDENTLAVTKDIFEENQALYYALQ